MGASLVSLILQHIHLRRVINTSETCRMTWSYFLTPALHIGGIVIWFLYSEFKSGTDLELGFGLTMSILNSILLIVLPIHLRMMEQQILEEADIQNSIDK